MLRSATDRQGPDAPGKCFPLESNRSPPVSVSSLIVCAPGRTQVGVQAQMLGKGRMASELVGVPC